MARRNKVSHRFAMDKLVNIMESKARDVLRAGLISAAMVDDTGARHQAANGFCTQIGNAQFRLVWDHVIEEPRQLPRPATRRR